MIQASLVKGNPSPTNEQSVSRRWILGGLGSFAILRPNSVLAGNRRAETGLPTLADLAERFPPQYPQFKTALEVVAEVGESIEVGDGPKGRRRIVPIIGGAFRGPGLSGKVLSGGADRQTFRADGIRELDAIYELQADDGTVLMVRNRAVVDDQKPLSRKTRYVRSVVRVTAPKGSYDWLNRRVLIGTLDSLRPEKPAVFLRFFVLE